MSNEGNLEIVRLKRWEEIYSNYIYCFKKIKWKLFHKIREKQTDFVDDVDEFGEQSDVTSAINIWYRIVEDRYKITSQAADFI